jgi:hypothetical protein
MMKRIKIYLWMDDEQKIMNDEQKMKKDEQKYI